MSSIIFSSTSFLQCIKSSNSKGNFYGHYVPIFGLICGLQGLSLEIIRLLYIRIFIRDMLSSATRLSVIGPLLAVRLQIEFIPVIEGLLNKRAAVSPFDSTEVNGDQSGEELIDISKCESYIHQTSPVLDLLQARHDMLYTRLFNS